MQWKNIKEFYMMILKFNCVLFECYDRRVYVNILNALKNGRSSYNKVCGRDAKSD